MEFNQDEIRLLIKLFDSVDYDINQINQKEILLTLRNYCIEQINLIVVGDELLIYYQNIISKIDKQLDNKNITYVNNLTRIYGRK